MAVCNRNPADFVMTARVEAPEGRNISYALPLNFTTIHCS
jgi:hypothetical protein